MPTLRTVLFILLVVPATLLARNFTVLVYNVENLHDVDGIASYEEYQPAVYTRNHLLTKVQNTAKVIARFEQGKGPDIILFQEIEIDHSPGPQPFDHAAFLQKYINTSVERMLTTEFNMTIADLPAEAFLLKALDDIGINGYNVVIGSDTSGHGGFLRSVKCVTFTRFPVKEVRQYPIPHARNILETLVDIDGHPFYLFNNHWKSGANDHKMELIRVQGARILRDRLNEILKANPNADILIGGDMNSQYNQRRLYNQKRKTNKMEVTAMNDILGSQGNIRRLRGEGSDFYNLWFELPDDKRGSDIYGGKWGTLMNMLVSRGLFDRAGVQYITDSFGVAKIPDLNMTEIGEPYDWTNEGASGRGFSDHFPIYAHFTTTNDNKPGDLSPFVRLSGSSTEDDGPDEQISAYEKIDISKVAIKPAQIPANSNLRDGSWSGKIFFVDAPAPAGRFNRVEFQNDMYDVSSYDEKIRAKLKKIREQHGRLKFYGELNLYRGRWQFLIKDAEWLLDPNSK